MKKVNNLKGKKKKKIVLAIVSSLLVIISLMIIVNSLDATRMNNELIASYQEKNTIDYRVYLKENNFYDEEYLPSGKQYITDIIDYVEVDFKHHFSISKLINSNYHYDVKATIVANYANANEDAEVWTKEFPIVSKKSLEYFGVSAIDLEDTITIDFQEYNNIAKEFIKEYSVPINISLIVTFNYSYQDSVPAENYDAIIENTVPVEIEIPLTKNVVSITTKNDITENETLYSNYGVDEPDSTILILSSLLLLISLPIAVMSILRAFVLNELTNYTMKLNKIKRQYADIVVETTSKPNLKDLEVIEIITFEDMVNIEEELRIPIIIYDVKKNMETWFIITNEDKAYRYILKVKTNKKLANKFIKE